MILVVDASISGLEIDEIEPGTNDPRFSIDDILTKVIRAGDSPRLSFSWHLIDPTNKNVRVTRKEIGVISLGEDITIDSLEAK